MEVPEGQAVGVTLYFKALRTNTENFAIGVYASDSRGRPYGQVVRFPGRGNYATSLWQPGDLIVDTFWVPIGKSQPAPAHGTHRRLHVLRSADAPAPAGLGRRGQGGGRVGHLRAFQDRVSAKDAYPAGAGHRQLRGPNRSAGRSVAARDAETGRRHYGDGAHPGAARSVHRLRSVRALPESGRLPATPARTPRRAPANTLPACGPKGKGRPRHASCASRPTSSRASINLAWASTGPTTARDCPSSVSQTITGTQGLWLSPGVIVK